MIAAALLILAVQSAAPASRPAANPAAANEAQARAALAKQGLSPAGVNTVVNTLKRRQPEGQALLNRVRQAAQGVQAAAARRPVDVNSLEAALGAQQTAVGALARAQQSILIEQLRGVSPADRVVLLRGLAPRPAPQQAPKGR
jgi:predicted lipid-binding transport protein (Tim44 family)